MSAYVKFIGKSIICGKNMPVIIPDFMKKYINCNTISYEYKNSILFTDPYKLAIKMRDNEEIVDFYNFNSEKCKICCLIQLAALLKSPYMKIDPIFRNTANILFEFKDAILEYESSYLDYFYKIIGIFTSTKSKISNHRN